MDIKTLLHNLREKVSCSGNPKTLTPGPRTPHYGPGPWTTYGPVHGLLLRTPLRITLKIKFKRTVRDREFQYPYCLSVTKSGHLMVCDAGNEIIQVFQLNGKFVGKFGTQGSNLGEFDCPQSLAVLSNGRIVVCEWSNHHIQILK